MEAKNAKSVPDFRMSLHGLRYDQTVPAQAPITTTASTSSLSPHELTTSHILATKASELSTNGGTRSQQGVEHDTPRNGDPLVLISTSTHGSQTSLATDDRAPSSQTSIPSVPQIRIGDDNTMVSKDEEGGRKWLPLKQTKSKQEEQSKAQSPVTQETFLGLTLDLPVRGLGDELQTKNMEFSNRGSMLLEGQKVRGVGLTVAKPRMPAQRIPTSSSVPERIPPRMMSTDEEMLSEKVRLFYTLGSDTAQDDLEVQTAMAKRMGLRWQDALQNDTDSMRTTSRTGSAVDMPVPPSPTSIVRENNELAGGLEDWQDIENACVDRYGFIVPLSPPQPPANQLNGVKRSGTTNGPGLQRVSTSLQLASETPRRKHTLRKSPHSSHSDYDGPFRRNSTHSSRSTERPASSRSSTVHRHGTLRAASNRLPGNRDRRLMDEAADMLTLPRSLTNSSLNRTSTHDSDHSTTSSKNPTSSKSNSHAARKKEAEREEKWRKMAKPIKDATSGVGGSMLFEFPPPTDPKLISRTWKGIPDSWRSAAWHYFLTASARKNPHSLPDDKLISCFYQYQDQNSPDDVQIDIDVPRTISSHIMFRRRYRGGQRLLFRVLHAMSLHFPETGYVQGMAALTATLLAYYEEEKAFVMLVRLWDVRGLGRLYQSGFGGLMEALDDFERGWLGEGEVAKKLAELNIVPTAYGTKWYLTLFNYSIPFPAQLRVWDVFMLLGDDESIADHKPITNEQYPPLGVTLDVLHAASAALIDGMRDILLESDFENAMKVLTSWIPIRDEDLFMRVAKAEWKMHRRKP